MKQKNIFNNKFVLIISLTLVVVLYITILFLFQINKNRELVAFIKESRNSSDNLFFEKAKEYGDPNFSIRGEPKKVKEYFLVKNVKEMIYIPVYETTYVSNYNEETKLTVYIPFCFEVLYSDNKNHIGFFCINSIHVDDYDYLKGEHHIKGYSSLDELYDSVIKQYKYKYIIKTINLIN